MKFKYSVEAAETIAKELLNTIPSMSPDVVIINVPSATSHTRQRGFDHARVIAKNLAILTKLQFSPSLARLGQARQVGSTRSQRQSQMEGVFNVINPGSVNQKHVLLVDDVITTGATIESAAKALKQAGAKSVDAVIFAQAPYSVSGKGISSDNMRSSRSNASAA